MKGHTYDHNKNEPCKLCGKVHIAKGAKIAAKSGKNTGMKGHTFDHGNGEPCKKCGKIHKVKISYSMLGHNRSHGKNEVCRLCGKIHHGKGWDRTGHTFDHCKGIPCKKCGKIHRITKEFIRKRRVHYAFELFWKLVEKQYRQSHETEHRSEGGKKSTETKLKLYGSIYKPETVKTFGNRPELSKKLRENRLKQVFPQKDSLVEKKLQAGLKKICIPFETHVALEGQPDLFIAPNLCIFVDGCYFHGCKLHYPENYTIGKKQIEVKRREDLAITNSLRGRGFVVLRFWEHEIKSDLDGCVRRVLQHISLAVTIKN